MAPLDDIFDVLEIANELEENNNQRIEAATKVRLQTDPVLRSLFSSMSDSFSPRVEHSIMKRYT